jgi:hypothetical protein
VRLGAQKKGFSINKVSFAAILREAYNPFPLDDVLIRRLDGTVRFGVGLEIADETDSNMRPLESVRIFLRRYCQ